MTTMALLCNYQGITVVAPWERYNWYDHRTAMRLPWDCRGTCTIGTTMVLHGDCHGTTMERRTVVLTPLVLLWHHRGTPVVLVPR